MYVCNRGHFFLDLTPHFTEDFANIKFNLNPWRAHETKKGKNEDLLAITIHRFKNRQNKKVKY